MTDLTQNCRTCGETKPLTEFWRQAGKKSGLFSECKTCATARNLQWIANNRARFRCANRKATSKARRKDPVRQIIRSIRSRCKIAGMECTITAADIIVPTHCPVLGFELVWNIGEGKGASLSVRDRSPSVDRIDNSKGYTPDNIVVVSYRANRLKSDANTLELRRLVDFYDNKIGGIGIAVGEGRAPSTVNHGVKKIEMPNVQPHQAQEGGPLSIDNSRWRGIRAALPQLQLERGGEV